MRRLLLIGLLFTAINVLQAEQSTTNQQKLAEKLVELEKLRAEVDQLRRETGVLSPQFSIRVRAMEVDSAKLSEAGIDNPFSAIQGWQPLDQQSLNRVLDAWDIIVKNDLAKVLADTTITTVEGRRERYRSGSEYPCLVRRSDNGTWLSEMKFVGLDLELQSLVRADDQIDLDCNFRWSERDKTRDITMPEGVALGIRTQSLCSRLRLKLGEALVLSGPILSQASGKTHTAWLIACERVDSPDKHDAISVGSASDRASKPVATRQE